MSSAAEDTGILVYLLRANTRAKGKKIKHKRNYTWEQIFPAPPNGEEPKKLKFLRGQNFDFQGARKTQVNRKIFREDDVVVVNREIEGDERAMYLSGGILGRQGALYYRASLKGKKGKTEDRWVLLSDPAQQFPEKLSQHVAPPPHVKDITGKAGDLIAVRPTGVDTAALRRKMKDSGAADPANLPPGVDTPNDFMTQNVTSYTYSLVTQDGIAALEPYDYNWILCTKDETQSADDAMKAKAKRLRAWLKSPEMRAFDRTYDAFEDNLDHCLDAIRSAATAALRDPNNETKHAKLREWAQTFVDQTVPSSTPGTTAPPASASTLSDILGSIEGKEVSGIIASGPEAIASGTALILDIKKLADGTTHSDDRNQIYIDLVDHSGKFIMSGAKLVEAALVLEQIARGAQVAASPAAHVASVIGVLTGILSTVRSSISFRRANRCNSKLVDLYLQMIADGHDMPQREITHLLHYAIRKTTRRTEEHFGTITTGVIGTLGGAVGIALLAGAAVNIWNPVGWTLAAVGLGIGLVVVGMKLNRRISRHKRHKRLRKLQNQGYPVTVDDFSRQLMRMLQDRSSDVTDRYYAGSILDCCGVRILWFETNKDLEDLNRQSVVKSYITPNSERFETVHGEPEIDPSLQMLSPDDDDDLTYPPGVIFFRNQELPDPVTSQGTGVPMDQVSYQYGWYERTRRRARKKIERALT